MARGQKIAFSLDLDPDYSDGRCDIYKAHIDAYLPLYANTKGEVIYEYESGFGSSSNAAMAITLATLDCMGWTCSPELINI